MEKRKKYRRIGQKVGTIMVIMQVVSVVVAVMVCVAMFLGLAMNLLRERCVSGTDMLEYVLSQTEEDKNTVLDEMKRRYGCEFTIFEGDTRAYTTVMQNGERVVGTKLSAPLSDIVLRQGRSYVGNADILGEEYLCSYVPTTDANGRVNGLIFAGISKADVNRQIAVSVLVSLLVGFAVISVCVLITASYLKKAVSAPLRGIMYVAGRLERGDFGLSSGEKIRIDTDAQDEVGDLSRIFACTIEHLRGYIGEISDVLEGIAAGDLTITMRQDYVGDFASIRCSMADIKERLNETMSQIRHSAGEVSDGAEQVSNSAQALAQGATEQASSVAQLSATVGEISDNAHKTAQATREAGQFVDQVGKEIHTGVEYVHQLNTAMEHISEASEEIERIITTIEDIAFQTDILALNAAVEAARAGSAGKSFAVVADEVRNLATKSDIAAKATKELIERSIAAVAEGGRAVKQVTQSLESTGGSVGGVTEKMAVAVAAVESQTAALAQITEEISQISAVVHTNSATSEECAAASQGLSSQAGVFRRLVASFRLEEDAARPIPGRHAAAR